MVKTGFSAVSGSCETMAMRRPRQSRAISASETWVRSVPSSSTRPATMRPPAFGSRRRIDRQVMVLPEPDSPMMPRVSPAASSRSMPSTARTAPRWRKMWVVRFSTRSSGAVCGMSELPAFRVEAVAQPVTEQVGRHAGQHDGDARHGDRPPGVGDVAARVGEHQPPGDVGVLNAEAKEAERGLEDDNLTDLQRGEYQQRVEDVGQQVAAEDGQRAAAGDAGQGDIVALLERKDFAAHDAGVPGPVADDDDDGNGVQARLEDGGEHQRQRERRDRHLDVDQAHDDGIDNAAKIAGGHADQRAEAAGEHDGVEGDNERNTGAGADAAEHVAAEIVGAEQVLDAAAVRPGGGLEGGAEIERVGIDRGKILAPHFGGG